eukprot:PITA_29459
MSFLDGFSGYNQIVVHPDDQLKTTFRTKWGTYAYQKMPFGVINVGATFQRAMDITFKGLINRTVVVYLDDVTVFSRERSNHLQDLNQIFQRCKKYGISPNPKKSFFALDQAVKHYRPFLLKAHTKVIVPFSSVRQLLIQRELGEKRANWVTALQEYDIEIKPTKIVRGQGFCRLLAGASNIPESSDTDQPETINQEAQRVLQELHDGPVGGHFGADTIAHKVIHAEYYWPPLFRDAHEYWVEAIPLKTTNSEAIIEFIDQFIITKFGVPNALVFDNASYFSGNAMFDFAIKRGFKLKYSANYYPQGNGLAESTNKNLIKIIKRTIEQNHKTWHKSLIFSLWADRVTQKASIGSSPFKLVYGKEIVLPTNLILPSLALVQFIEENPSSSLQLRHDQILKLEEEREKAKIIHAKNQQIIKSSFDSISSRSKQFQVGDLVMKWDKSHEDKGKHTKFQKMWLGLFQICEKIGHSTFMLQDLSGLRDSLPVNGLVLKKIFN